MFSEDCFIENLRLYFLGQMNQITFQNGEKDKDLQIIDRIEESQCEGRLLIVPEVSQNFFFSLSPQGVKLTEGNLVLSRYPLSSIAQIIFYHDAFGKSNLIVKTNGGKDEDATSSNLLLFQTLLESEAVLICQTFKKIFDIFLNSS